MPKANKHNTRQATLQNPDLRALTLVGSLSPNLKTFRITDDASAPHLREGEYAVIDVSDREPQSGELFLIQGAGHERRRHISQLKSDLLSISGRRAKSLVWWIGDLAGYRQIENISGVPVFAGLSDGPYETPHVQSVIVGRVVGVSLSPLGGMLAPSLGWENEDAGNRAFDPGDYIDTLMAAGYRPEVAYDRAGHPHLMETFPRDRESKANSRAVMAARTKYGEASLAVDRVIAECIRRGLVC